MLFIIAVEYKGSQKKKSLNDIKDEVLGSVINIEKNDEPGLDDVVGNGKDTQEAVGIIKEYEKF